MPLGPLDRRTVLRGAGIAIALPLLEAMAPRARAQAAAGHGAPPRRLVYVYAPNGVNRAAWKPAAEGALESLPPTLEPLAPWRDRVLVLSGLAVDAARAHGDGPGDHARACASFLTCAHPRKTDGTGLRAGVSVDQFAAQRIGDRARFRSLQIGLEEGARAGACDSGYACAYSGNLSWSTPESPCAKEVDPRLLFDRLFREGGSEDPSARAARLALRRSVLDLAREEAARLRRRLGAEDARKLDEYETAVREVERRLVAAAEGRPDVPDDARPPGVPPDRGEHARALADVLALALRTDSTRIATFSLGNEGSNASHRQVDVPEGHHEISHHGNDADKLAKVARIDRFHVGCLAHLVQRLAEAEEAGASVLDRAFVVYGSGIGDGNAHDHGDLPVLAIGGGVAGGRHVVAPKETPLANLHLAMLAELGIAADGFADSTGVLAL